MSPRSWCSRAAIALAFGVVLSAPRGTAAAVPSTSTPSVWRPAGNGLRHIALEHDLSPTEPTIRYVARSGADETPHWLSPHPVRVSVASGTVVDWELALPHDTTEVVEHVYVDAEAVAIASTVVAGRGRCRQRRAVLTFGRVDAQQFDVTARFQFDAAHGVFMDGAVYLVTDGASSMAAAPRAGAELWASPRAVTRGRGARVVRVTPDGDHRVVAAHGLGTLAARGGRLWGSRRRGTSLVGLDTDGRRQARWRLPSGWRVFDIVARDEGACAVATRSGNEARIDCVDATATPQWSRVLTALGDTLVTTPNGDVALVDDGRLELVDTSGRTRWSIAVPAGVQSLRLDRIGRLCIDVPAQAMGATDQVGCIVAEAAAEHSPSAASGSAAG